MLAEVIYIWRDVAILVKQWVSVVKLNWWSSIWCSPMSAPGGAVQYTGPSQCHPESSGDCGVCWQVEEEKKTGLDKKKKLSSFDRFIAFVLLSFLLDALSIILPLMCRVFDKWYKFCCFKWRLLNCCFNFALWWWTFSKSIFSYLMKWDIF